MAKIEDLINEIPDTRLRQEIGREVAILKKQKKFGLVFEEHIPETVQMPDLPVRPGVNVVKREVGNERIYFVKQLFESGKVVIQGNDGNTLEETVSAKELVVIKRFGDPIYPTLTQVAKLSRAEGKPYHTIINADNFHALQLLLYCYSSQVDVVYIDPPYNTGARDWKYNNDYVDDNDQWRHSKWLSMMKKRLLLAKRLLKNDGVLIVTIDDYELQSLTPLLSDLKATSLGRVCICIKPEGRRQSKYVMEAHEYALMVSWGKPKIRGLNIDFGLDFPDEDSKGKYRWEGLMRRDAGREDRGSDYWFPFHVGPTGELSTERHAGYKEVWPINTKGIERVWAWDKERATHNMDELKAEVRGERVSVYYKRRKMDRSKPTSFWYGSRYNANAYGTRLLEAILPGTDFNFPKSIYSVLDCIDLFLPEDGLLLDFFAGSGTTYHAAALLNADDKGTRRCILVTNNEVSEKQAQSLIKEGHHPGSPIFEKHGICESVTWPRCKFVTQGHRDDKTPIPGKYSNGHEMKQGFNENLKYFRLDFLDPHEIAYGEKFEAILPILWLMAGAKGELESARGYGKWFIPKNSPYAVLIKEDAFGAFKRELKARPDIAFVYLVTNSDEAFREMSSDLPGNLRTKMLYKSYLDNFRINTEKFR